MWGGQTKDLGTVQIAVLELRCWQDAKTLDVNWENFFQLLLSANSLEKYIKQIKTCK